MLIIYEILWLTARQLESFQAVNIHFLSKHIKRRRLQFIWEWVVTNFQIGNLEKSLMVFNTLDASLFFFFSIFLFIFILSLIFFFSVRDQTQSLCMQGYWSTTDLHPKTQFSFTSCLPRNGSSSFLCETSPPIPNPSYLLFPQNLGLSELCITLQRVARVSGWWLSDLFRAKELTSLTILLYHFSPLKVI